MANTQLITRLRHLLAVVLLLHAGAAVASAQTWHTTIEISHPAQISLPQEVSDLLLVNNTVAHPDIPMGAFYTLMAAAETLEGSDYMPSVLEASQNSTGSLYRKHPLTDVQADSLLTLYQSQALLVLNQLIVHPTTEGYPTEDETYYTCMQTIAAAHWTLFFRNGESKALRSRTLVYADTLYWESEADSPAAAAQALPATEDACSEMCVYVGEHLAQRFMPTSETADRYLYDLGKTDAGMQHFTRRQWQQAISVWSEPQRDARLTAYAMANCAVAYEILGDLGAAYAACGSALTALDGLHSANDRQQAVNIRYYQEQLRKRMNP